MTHLLLSPAVLHPLGLVLMHFLWQGFALMALAWVFMAVCRSAQARYALAVGALAAMLAAPIVTFLVVRPRSSAAAWPAAGSSTAAHQVTRTVARVLAVGTALMNAQGSPKAPRAPRPDVYLWLAEAWFAGVIFFSMRAAGGMLVLARLRRRELGPLAPELIETCLNLQRRLGLTRVIRYCECRLLDAPAVIGWFRPIVLLPLTAVTGLSPRQLEAVIAHELAHIRRLDAFVNLFQTAGETLLFYHPAVWWLSGRIRAERENCCDDAAVEVCGGPAEYARALMLMEELRTPPMLAMAANQGSLRARVLRLLGSRGTPRRGQRELRTAGFAVALLGMASMVLAGNALLGMAHSVLDSRPALAHEAAVVTARIDTHIVLHETLERTLRAERAVAATRVVHTVREAVVFRQAEASDAPAAYPNVASYTTPAPDRDPNPEVSQNASGSSEEANGKESYLDGLTSAGLTNLSADELIALKVQGVTPAYVRAIHDLGLKPSVDELVGMKVQGVTPEYIRDVRAQGFNPNIDEIIGFKVQGVSPEYIQNMRALGFNPTADEIVGLKVQGVTPDYIREMHAKGFDLKLDDIMGMKVQGVTPEYIDALRAAGFKVTAEEVIGMKVQGVTPDYIRDMRAAGVDPKSDELIGLKVQGVTPEYVRELKAEGIKPTADELIGLKVQGVTPEYIRGIKAQGLSTNVDELVGMKVQGVTPEYVRDMRAAGFNATTDQLIGMKTQGVTPAYVKALQAAGLKNLDLDDLISAKVMGVTPEFIEKAKSHGFKDLTLEKLIALKQAEVF
ncbi:MAG TPA: M56 family metallopeptidase [Terriglobia bacterium]|jgi:beta-lactamase regulating signal transducer with metallopeptidase domain|nr:M56 family metallopeptidase [Terriglobia bacterium]